MVFSCFPPFILVVNFLFVKAHLAGELPSAGDVSVVSVSVASAAASGAATAATAATGAVTAATLR